jgi:hypothetical protein
MVNQERFRDMCSEAEKVYNGADLESVLVEVLRLAESCPEARPELAECFIALLHHPEWGPWEVVQFCMHKLCWPEVRAAVEEDLGNALAAQDWRAIPVLHHILAAFDAA